MLVLSRLVKPRELNMCSYFPVSLCEREKDRERMCTLKETMMASRCAAETHNVLLVIEAEGGKCVSNSNDT